MKPVSRPATFVADCAGLDFLNSGDPSHHDRPDWMASGEALLSWLEQARLVPRARLQQLRSETDPKTLDRVAARARELREWLRGFVNRYRGRPLAGIDVSNFELLNRILMEDEKYCQIVA